MTVHNAKNLWSGVMFIAFGAFFLFGAQEYPMGTAARMGPGYFPTILSVLLILLGLVIAFAGIRPFEGEGDAEIGRFDLRSLLLIVAALAAFGFLLPIAGFVVALLALILMGAFASHEFRLGQTLGLTVVLLLVALVVFIWGLELRLPILPAAFAQ